MTLIQEIARRAAKDEQARQIKTGLSKCDVRAVADAVASAVWNAAMASIKARGEQENHVIAPGMLFAAGYLRQQFDPSLASVERSGEQQEQEKERPNSGKIAERD